jgi:hypothetical protein
MSAHKSIYKAHNIFSRRKQTAQVWTWSVMRSFPLSDWNSGTLRHTDVSAPLLQNFGSPQSACRTRCW